MEPANLPAGKNFAWLAGLLSGCSFHVGVAIVWLAIIPVVAEEGMEYEPTYSQPWQVTSYADEAGVSQQRIFDIDFTPDGTVWLASDGGLLRYDGFTWSWLGTNCGLPSSFVRSVCLDGSGRLWVGSDAGAGIWDYNRRKYETMGSETGLPNANVREITEDPDGTLWYACDQWPETTGKPGGLGCLKPGPPIRWQTFQQVDGLPMDYVIGYFRDSTGRQFALTPHGWSQRQGDQWGPPANPGYQAEDCVLQMAEARDGTLFAQGENTLLTLTDGRWQSHPDSRTRAVCATKNGQMAAVEYDAGRGQLWFSLWDGARFVPASAPVTCPAGARFYRLREAPDGSLWCVGIGIVVRWDCRTQGKWALHPNLPPPLGADARGRVWFGERSHLAVFADGQFRRLAPGKLRGLSDDGQAMIWDDQRDELTVTTVDDPTVRLPVRTECQTIQHIIAKDGVFWILGQDKENNSLAVRYENGRTRTVSSPEFRGYYFTSGTILASNQVVVVAHQVDNNQYGLVRITDDNIAWLPFDVPPPLTYPNLIVGAGQCWLYGYSGLYRQSAEVASRWEPVTGLPDSGYGQPLASADEMLLAFSGGRSGRAGCTLFASNRWNSISGEFRSPAWGPDNQTIYFCGRKGVFIRRQPGRLDLEFLRNPNDMPVNKVVPDRSGTLWMGTADGTFRYRPGRTAPETVIVTSTAEIRRGQPLPVTVRAKEQFSIAGDTGSFRYSWRIDGQGWSAFETWPDSLLQLPALRAGAHGLEVRARDVDGNIDPTPATVPFSILAEPLQNQPWFKPVVVLVAGVLAWLLWQQIAQLRRIAVANAELRREIEIRRRAEAELARAHGELEQRVAQRTEQLTRANKRLIEEITERLQAEEAKRQLIEQLHHSQKMEAVGTLAGGIAHDFNNILAIIIPYCDIVMGEIRHRPDLQEHLQIVLKAANRAKNLVQQILTFSRRQPHQQREICHLQPIVKEALKLIRSALPSSIHISEDIRDTHPVLADPTQVHQVVMNLCVNAQHAMEGRQGLLEVRMDEFSADESFCERHSDLQPGLHVRLSVRDNGCGIPPELLKRIFEPFFSTRDVGRGTGLGLAVVHGIVQSHSGAIWVQSEPGQGTEFHILLPARKENVDEVNPAIQPLPQAEGEHILIVDDEPAIVQVLKQLLTRAGYHVSAYNNPQEVLNDFLSRPADISLILTDLTMPGMTGLELAGKVHEVRPDLPMIIATGFGGDLIMEAQLRQCPNVRKIIQKPLFPQDILRLIGVLLLK
jgi:signal transduction histidine kinase